MNIIEEAKKVLSIEAEAIAALINRIGDDFEMVVETLYKSKGRTVITGMGKSGIIGKKIAATLSSTGTPAVFMHPADAAHGDLGMVTDKDIILAISNSGETEEIIKLIPYIKRFHVTLLSMTKPYSSLYRASDIGLDTSVSMEACPMDIVPTASTTAALAMGDAIAVALMHKRGFREEDFALFHPDGPLGRKLLVKVEELMHTDDDIPLVNEDTPVPDSIIEISSKRLGITVVCNGENQILGIITDGDLRRGIEKWGQEFFTLKAGDVMAANPKKITKDTLAAKALSIMEDNSITSLIVSDNDNRPSGIIHIHDILKKGIV